MIDYDITSYGELEELAKDGDTEARERIIAIDEKRQYYLRLCDYAMTGQKEDYSKGKKIPFGALMNKRTMGRKLLEIYFPKRCLFFAEGLVNLETTIRNVFPDIENRPDWIDLVASALIISLNDPKVYKNFTLETIFQDGSRQKQKRRGLLLAAVKNEIERSLLGGIIFNTDEYKNKKENEKREFKLQEDQELDPFAKKKYAIINLAENRAESEDQLNISDVKKAIADLNISSEDMELLFIEQGDIKKIAETRGIPQGTLRQRRKRIIDKIREKIM